MNQVSHIFYINLKSRPDRMKFCLEQLASIGASPETIERFEAIENKNGHIGASLSHIQCLKLAIERNYENVMIVEDDIYFTDPTYFKSEFPKIFQYNFDVFMLGVHLYNFEKIDQNMIRVLGGGTLTGYVVKKHYYQKLLDNYKKGLELLLKTGIQPLYCVDAYPIRKLQPRDQWITFSKLTVTQVQNYSDIEKKVVNYDGYMMKNIETMKKIDYESCFKHLIDQEL
jgi:GR25 family glycosyltransferase involved in LPS biosynthesis